MSTDQAISQLIPAPRTPLAAPSPPPTPLPREARVPRLAGRRARFTINDRSDLPFSSPLYIIPPPDADSTWRTLSLDSKTLSRMTPADLTGLLVDISPEISRALFDFIRMFNPGWECDVFRPNSEEDIDRRGQQAVDDFFKSLSDLYGSVDLVLNRLILAGFMRGAFFAEMVLDPAGRLPVDLATPDPYSARFRKVTDPVRGTIYQLGQFQASGWKPLDFPTISYIPIDPLSNSPYGRALMSPAIFAAIFLIGMLHDLRRVVQQQGWPRLDLAVAMEGLKDLFEQEQADAETDPEGFGEWVEKAINQVVTEYEKLLPDDAYVHTDIVTVNRPVGTVNADSLGAVDGLIMGLERMVTRALKTMPLLMGLQEGGSETHANRQWELHAAGIKSIQHLLENLLQRLLTVMLQAQGLQARVEFRFAELRASEMLRDAQTEAMQIANATAKYQAGWISQDEASLEVTGHEADQETPRRAAAPASFVQGDGENEEPQAGEDRWLALWNLEQSVKEMRQQLVELRGSNGNGHKTN